MVIEAVVYIVIAVMMLIVMIKKVLEKRYLIYYVSIALQIIGIIIGILSLRDFEKTSFGVMFAKYALGIILPIIVLGMTKKRKGTKEDVAMFEKIEMLIENKEYDTAKKILLEMQEKDQTNIVVHKLLAKVYEQQEKNVRAIEESILAINIDDKDYDSYLVAARNSEKIDKKEEAKIFLKDMLNKNPNVVEGIELLGNILISEGKYNEAIDIYQEALKNNPGSYELLLDLGIAYTYLNDFETASMFYDRAAEVNTMKHVMLYTTAQIDLIYKKLDEAEKKFQELTEDEELSAEAYFELSKIYLIKKDKETALRYITIALEVNQKKILPKIQKDQIFMPIITKIRLPEIEKIEDQIDNEEDKESDEIIEKEELTEKELSIVNYLDSVIGLTKDMTTEEVEKLKEERIDIQERIAKNNMKAQEKDQIENM